MPPSPQNAFIHITDLAQVKQYLVLTRKQIDEEYSDVCKHTTTEPLANTHLDSTPFMYHINFKPQK